MRHNTNYNTAQVVFPKKSGVNHSKTATICKEHQTDQTRIGTVFPEYKLNLTLSYLALSLTAILMDEPGRRTLSLRISSGRRFGRSRLGTTMICWQCFERFVCEWAGNYSFILLPRFCTVIVILKAIFQKSKMASSGLCRLCCTGRFPFKFQWRYWFFPLNFLLSLVFQCRQDL